MNTKTKSLAFIGVMTALIAIIAPLSVTLPFTPVPISFANLIIYICSAVIGWKRSSIAVILYIFIGAVGIPVFSKYASGIGYLLGPTGGYIVGFIFCALCTGFASDKFTNKKIPLFIGMILGTILCYALGTIWYIAVMTLNPDPEKTSTVVQVLFACVIPFIPGDIIKIIIAFFVGSQVKSRVAKL